MHISYKKTQAIWIKVEIWLGTPRPEATPTNLHPAGPRVGLRAAGRWSWIPKTPKFFIFLFPIRKTPGYLEPGG
ncbi:hypothetical protein D7Z54_29345 [Salibacterium salarium]|uniref:Uncharacterized protein n=1 Tax=Salibacterium salarium TaxID=284579 RepID=A0A3R9PYH2_9BACI|nr:hypothetical protein D7Z54_29345 [Salibacterium salarium]